MVKTRIAVIFGGTSSEHGVSLISAASVIENLSGDLYEIIPIGITKKGRWLYYPGSIEKIASGDWEKDPGCIPAVISPDRAVKGLLLTPPGERPIVKKIDVAFPVLHGKYGEDGTIQGLFALADLPYVGCDTLSSAICMDKEMTNALLDHADIPHTPWGVIRHGDLDRFDDIADGFERRLGYPMFIKPANAGSSVGVSKVKNRQELEKAVSLAMTHDHKVIAERAVAGKELECAVFGNDDPVASVVSEIVPNNEFYDYASKYDDPSVTHLPARIDDALSNKLRETAVVAYRLLGCAGMARVDFLYEDATGILFLNELNTIPGFTAISMYPKMMEASGMPYPELLKELIHLAVERNRSGR